MDINNGGKKWSRIVQFLKKDSSGVALLLALGMLSLLFVIAVGFVSTTESDLKMAETKSNDLQVRLLAESGLNDALCFMKTNFVDSDVADSFRLFKIGPVSSSYWDVCNLDSRRLIFTVQPVGDKDYSANHSGLNLFGTNFKYEKENPSTASTDIDYNSNTSFFDWINDKTLSKWTPACTTITQDKCPWSFDVIGSNPPVPLVNYICAFSDKNDSTVAFDSAHHSYYLDWQYVRQSLDATPDAKDKIIGRYAFVLLDDNGKMNTTGFLDSTTNERLGADLSEITRSDYLSTLAINSDTLPNDAAVAAFILADSMTRDQGFRDIRYLENGDVPYLSNDYKAQLPRRVFNHFYNTRMDNTLRLTDEKYLNEAKTAWVDRFNLARTDWSSMTVATLCDAPDTWGVDSPRNGNGIEWLQKWTTAGGAGTYANATAMAHQIAANLIDYCDSDNDPTLPPLYSFPSDPEYVGLEQGAQLSELDLGFSATIVKTPHPTTPGQYQYAWSAVKADLMRAEVFFLNLSGAATAYCDVIPHIKVTATCGLYASESDASAIAGTTLVTTWIYPSSGVDALSGALSFAGSPDQPFRCGEKTGVDFFATLSQSSAWIPDDIAETAIVLKITNLNVRLYLTKSDGSTLVDFAHVATGATVNIHQSLPAYVNWETDDPRQNQNPGDWHFNVIANVSDFTNDKLNKAFNPPMGMTTDSDFDAGWPGYAGANTGGGGNGVNVDGFGVSPSHWGCSTRFIRNAPMTSPWELGAIHRAGAWQTLNLKNYSATNGTYANGDAKILDQIKMNANSKNPKLDICVKDMDLLKAMYSRIKVPYASGSSSSINMENDNGYANVPASAEAGIDRNAADTAPMLSLRDAIARAVFDTANHGAITNRAQVATTNTSNPMMVMQYEQGVDNSFVPVDTSKLSPTDMGREAVIGKTVNLLKVGSGRENKQRFSVIVIAQSIKDIGPAHPNTIPFNVDINKDGQISSTGIKESESYNSYGYNVDYDGDGFSTNSAYIKEQDATDRTAQQGRYDQYIDKITGTAKIYAVIERDPSTTPNKYRIVSINFMDESSETSYE